MSKSNSPEKKYQLVISSEIENIEKVESFTEKISKLLNFSEDERDRIAIAVTEAVNNAIIHGNKLDPRKSVSIDISAVRGGIQIVVKDEGEGFDLDAVPNPLAPENLLKESGRGIFILKSLMDKVQYDFSRGGTQVTMIKFKNKR